MSVYFFSGYLPFPLGLATLLLPLPNVETLLLSTSCSPSDSVASLTSPSTQISAQIISGYYGFLDSFTVTKGGLVSQLYLINYYQYSSYTPCLQLPFTNVYLIKNASLYIFFALSYGT